MSGDHNQYQKSKSYLDDFECPRCGHCCKAEWVGLTDDEIASIDGVEMKYIGTGEYVIDGEYEFARAIEAKLKEKNA
jgi:Fe-S-cluster containining protein